MSRAANAPAAPPQLALKIDVDTLRGTREGVPALLSALAAHGADATFLFSLGPDHTGRAIRRAFRPGFFSKVSRTSVLEHYGVRTLLYGTLLPGPDIGRRAADGMRSVRAQGHEVGVHCFDHTTWQDFVTRRDGGWARKQMQLAVERFHEVFGSAPRVHGAAGWQMTDAALQAEEALGFTYASDTRGAGPFVPCLNGRRGTCPQLPTTLPTLDELIGLDGIDAGNVHTHLLARTRDLPAHQVFTLHAELEGMKLLPVLQRLLQGWRAQGYALVAMHTLLVTLDVAALAAARVESGTVPGRSGTLAVQGAPRSASTT
ncbi:MAG TPA: polysaccharide deacetylase family protein [Steroidobacteraceae bacterium]|jgi:peptidoglycan/xylan/chitin deacetylase (PgdA/CDA1 family)|nr:polysaccharide deacetylase family protein [Steroidobacteraceae bacterium]